MTSLSESDIENIAIELLEEQGYVYLSPERQETERSSTSEVVLRASLESAIAKLNPKVPDDAKEQALLEVLNLSSQDLTQNNEIFQKMLTDGIGVEYQKQGNTVGDRVYLLDFENPQSNSFFVWKQFTVSGKDGSKRPDIVLFVNGLPLVVIELKNPNDKEATIKKAYSQLQNYKKAIPSLFHYNGVMVASDGLDAKAGSLTAEWARFMHWKTIDGIKEDKENIPQIETLIKGMLRPDVLLDLIKQFVVFEKTIKKDPETMITSIETSKKIAAYHQYHAVNKAVVTTKKASAENGDRKAGVVWHTQGSGKSLSMVFYAGKIVLELDNPTILIITDRSDLDNQLFDTFAKSKQLLRQEPVRAESSRHLKKLLKTAGGGVVFATIQKFSPEDNKENFDLLSERKNIVVIADEAHRSHYGFGAKILEKENEAFTKYGFAKYLRDALPKASFVGFTGTPIEREDISTPAVFGNYIDIYDVKQAIEDGATVKIFYESRLAQMHLDESKKEELDAEIEKITEDAEESDTEKAKAKWTRLEAIIGHKERLKKVAQDIINHFEARREVLEGKGMVVAMSRRIAVALYDEMIKLRPDWHDTDKSKGAIKVIMTSSPSDPENWQLHNTNKEEKREIGERLKNPKDPLQMVIVRDMWLTGFDAPCLHTMYIDKPMRGHNLMQAIARVNRVYNDKPGGLVVDYIGIASDLKQALATYTESKGKGTLTLDQSEAITMMLEKYEIVQQMFEGFDYKRYFSADKREKLTIILEAHEHIVGPKGNKDEFIKEVSMLAKAFALSVPSHEAMEIKEELGFFQAIQVRLKKFTTTRNGKSDIEIETAIRQIVDKAVVTSNIIDIFDAVGIKKPDISILSDEFLEEVRNMKHKNLAIELLKKLLSNEIKTRTKRNFIQSEKLSEMLEATIKKYENNLLTTKEVIQALIEFAQEIREEKERNETLGLSEDEVAFYDALADNDSAKEVLRDSTLRELAQILVEKVKASTTIDWTIKESVQAKLRVIVKRILRKYGYPPDKEKMATIKVLKQAELFADVWDATSSR